MTLVVAVAEMTLVAVVAQMALVAAVAQMALVAAVAEMALVTRLQTMTQKQTAHHLVRASGDRRVSACRFQSGRFNVNYLNERNQPLPSLAGLPLVVLHTNSAH